ncbi:hypothetical protein GCM10010274_24320 [Streptomyces lavendofoliae]|uniref:Uncharacterized protein n=1 Tax=Streptomyces lavendofoliae TaxID=67314 RepID=A0A918HW30_9ACTN|nr:hypothetical protein GCM10010274_24320 [Streptomyces lavendofoliae]
MSDGRDISRHRGGAAAGPRMTGKTAPLRRAGGDGGTTQANALGENQVRAV